MFSAIYKRMKIFLLVFGPGVLMCSPGIVLPIVFAPMNWENYPPLWVIPVGVVLFLLGAAHMSARVQEFEWFAGSLLKSNYCVGLAKYYNTFILGSLWTRMAFKAAVIGYCQVRWPRVLRLTPSYPIARKLTWKQRLLLFIFPVQTVLRQTFRHL